MASISTRHGDNSRRILFRDADGNRKEIWLGQMPLKQCQSICRHVEKILTASISGCSYDAETASWLAELSEVLRGKLSRVGLIQARQNSTLEAFVNGYIAGRNDAKPNTLANWNRTRKYLLSHFDVAKPLRSITKADAKGFRQYLIGRKLAENTIRRSCGIAKQFFADALERKLIDENPFRHRDIPTTTTSNQERMAYVDHETAKSVIDACPDAEWRLLFALSRYAGLRCPSEHLSLRWEDINWQRSRMVVRSPKTERHEGGAMRVVPIFHELRPYLEEAQELAGKSEYVIARYRERNCNLRTQLLRIVNRAGVKPWPKLFHNLRSSCETDLARVHTIKAVCDWLGHDVTVAAQHYLQVTEEDFERATLKTTQPASITGCQRLSDNERREVIRNTPRVLPRGSEFSPGVETDSASSCQDNTLRQAQEIYSAYFTAFSPNLTLEEWRNIPPEVRAAIVALSTDHRPADPASGSAQPPDRSMTDDDRDKPRDSG